MLTRRHIRVKVLQSIYALRQSNNPDLEKQEKFLFYSIDQMLDLYALSLQLLVEMRKADRKFLVTSQQKHLATSEEKNFSTTFLDNKVLDLIEQNEDLSNYIQNKKLNYWDLDGEYVTILLKDLRAKDFYKEYILKQNTSFKEDQDFLVSLFKKVIAPSDKYYEYIEDKRLTWVDDFPIVNTALAKMLAKISEKNVRTILLPELYKNQDDKQYAKQLFTKVVLNDEKLSQEIEGKTPNWDKERIAEMDMIILKMGIAEFLHFPSIPVRATINEYLEIAKEYSTPKSSIFINGILDKLVKEFETSKKLNKIGRGLR
ncbi:transcription antitermination factor NusB [Flavobacteriaceae bacterium]|nr:transcription antitermination factor NusB [Flavobacteriaceae bacterium]MDA9246874.1 transcription antitermination factor NusB [Flavobacteriaceae bacterium]MDA9283642.1 transcription antitermination factor NusB [Flavobacteriaceae bacterium]MDA9284342.1 transcription antitermination factor NusB [Flavobacteriaceae bacterium]MDA9309400.1 transcription antitermination factor NusB [Flavobacteriaceae bacterium]